MVADCNPDIPSLPRVLMEPLPDIPPAQPPPQRGRGQAAALPLREGLGAGESTSS